MGWRDLLQKEDEFIVLPWLGEKELRSGPRAWTLRGRHPEEHGWYVFKLDGRNARLGSKDDQERKPAAESPPGILDFFILGYLVGDRLVKDDIRVDPNPANIAQHSEPVHLIEPGLDRFVRVRAGRAYEDGPLVFEGQEMPLGAEDDVLRTYLDEGKSLENIKGVPPALDAAFRMETWQRVEAEKRRIELERIRLEEEARRAKEERRQKLVEQLGDAAGRRAMALVDFAEAARAALAVGGAQYLDHRRSVRRHEMIVKFRFIRRRFECICDAATLRIIDAGICLTDHHTGEKGDNFFTLESLPAVIQQAENEGKLVVFRHVD